MPKGSETPQITAADVQSKNIPLLAYDATAPSGQNFVRVPKDAIAPPANTKWTKITDFRNGWSNFGTPFPDVAVRKINDRLEIIGVIKNGNLNTVAFVLPAGVLPGSLCHVVVMADATQFKNPLVAAMATNGEVTIYGQAETSASGAKNNAAVTFVGVAPGSTVNFA